MQNEIVKATPNLLLEKAIELGSGIEQLKELMDLQERWEKKEARKSFFDSLSKFQSIVPVINKGKTANIKSEKGGFSYKYSDLGSIAQAIKNALNECGFSYRWEFKEADNKMKVTCLVSHRDGHTEETTMEGGLDNSGAKNGIQQKGSTHTYLQRYTLIGALGLSTADVDNDAANAPKTDKILLADLQSLFDLKQEFLNAEELASAKKILSGKDEKNYSRLHKFLQTK